MKIAEILGQSSIIIMYALLAAWNISGSVNSFIAGRHFLGGVNAMIALWMACGLIRAVFCGVR